MSKPEWTPSQVPGHTKPAAGRELQKLASLVLYDRAVVEIGVFKGRSACYLGWGAKNGHGAKVWGFDPWDLPGDRYPYHWLEERPSRHAFTRPETREAAFDAVRRCGLEGTVTLTRAHSVDGAAAWNGPPVALLHVDGDHRAEAVRADWEAWSPHLARGATVCFDDHVPTCPDVPQVVSELVRGGLLTPPRMATRRLAVCRLTAAAAP